MTFLFWLFWTIDLLIAAINWWSIGFRGSFGASTDLNIGLNLGLVVVLAASLVLRFAFKLRMWSLGLVALPLLFLLVAYLVDTRNKTV